MASCIEPNCEDLPQNLELDPHNPLSWEIVLGCSENEAKVRKLILVSLHGNEVCGLNAVNALSKSGCLQNINSTLKTNKNRVRKYLI